VKGRCHLDPPICEGDRWGVGETWFRPVSLEMEGGTQEYKEPRSEERFGDDEETSCISTEPQDETGEEKSKFKTLQVRVLQQ